MPRLYPVLFALCVPLVFLHADYQPSFTRLAGWERRDPLPLRPRGARDRRGRCRGRLPARLRSAQGGPRDLDLLGGVPRVRARGHGGRALRPTDGYPLADNLLTAAKLAEYALLALAAPLAIRGAQELLPLLVVAHRVERRGDVRSAAPVPRRPERVRGPSARAARAVVPRHPRPRGALRRGARDRPARARARASGSGSGSSRGIVGGLGVILSGATAAVVGVAAAGACCLAARRVAARSRSPPSWSSSSAPGRSRSGRSTRGRSSTRSGIERPRDVGDRPGGELAAARRARLHRRPDLPRPPARRRRLAGLVGGRALRAVPRRRARAASPTCPSARSRRPSTSGASRTPTSRRRPTSACSGSSPGSRSSSSRSRVAWRAGARAGRPYPVAAREHGHLDRTRPRGGDPARRPDVALDRARRGLGRPGVSSASRPGEAPPEPAARHADVRAAQAALGLDPRRGASRSTPSAGRTACSTSAAASSRTTRGSSRTSPSTSGSTSAATRTRTLDGTIESIPAEDASFDLVLCTQVLEHCDDPAQGVRELRRVTKPGGRVLALDPRRDGLPPCAARPLALDARGARAPLPYERHMDER